jgi:hypothetical protein
MFGWLWTALTINGVVEFGIELQSDEQFRLFNHFLRERKGKADLEWLGNMLYLLAQEVFD